MRHPDGAHTHGHGGSGIDPVALVVIAVVVIAGPALAAALVALVWVTLAVVAVVLVLGAVLLTWWLLTQPARKARWAETYRAAFAAREEADQRQALQRQAFALELARASAPVINNIIDPALIAAAVAGAHLQPQAVRALRGEVEK